MFRGDRCDRSAGAARSPHINFIFVSTSRRTIISHDNQELRQDTLHEDNIRLVAELVKPFVKGTLNLAIVLPRCSSPT